MEIPGSNAEGKDRRRVTATFDLATDAGKWVEDTRSDMRRGVWRDPTLGATLLGDWVSDWRRARLVEPETAVHDGYQLRNHVLPHWGNRPVGSIRRIDVQAWITGMIQAGKGQPTIESAYFLLRSILSAAVEEDMIAQSPCRKIKLPDKPSRTIDWWTVEQVETILSRLDGHWQVVAALMAWCGLRWEEAAGLPVENVNWLRREITVTQVVAARRIKLYPKDGGDAGCRTIRMAGPVAELLEPAWSAAAGAGHADGLIWVASDGRPLFYRSWWAYWQRRIAGAPGRAGVKPRPAAPVPQYSPHSLRKSGASWLVQGGVPLAMVQAWLGHNNPGSTAIYATLAPDHSNARIGEVLAGLEGQQRKADHG